MVYPLLYKSCLPEKKFPEKGEKCWRSSMQKTNLCAFHKRLLLQLSMIDRSFYAMWFTKGMMKTIIDYVCLVLTPNLLK
uniref:Uncharacterized protein n=1 Tax=Romanomermis culicivorax TaxID=13658 RepID=A0A915I7L7_ROMCU